MELSNRAKGMSESPIRKLAPYAAAAQDAGKKVYPLNIGQPDIKTPPHFFSALNSYTPDVLAYAHSAGDIDLIRAIIDYYKSYGMNYDEKDVLITNGASEALLFTMTILCDPGDNIAVFEPYYTNYQGFAAQVDVDIIGITTKAEDGYRLPSRETIIGKINDKTKALLLNNPSNPTGAVYSPEECQMIVDIALEKDIFIIADEVYREFVYDGLALKSFGEYPEADQHVIIVDSVSKRFSACGARVGAIISKHEAFMNGVLKLCQGRLCVPTLEMKGAAALYNTSENYFEEVNKEYQKRRDVIYEALKAMPGVICEEPKGAFYVAVKLPVDNAEDFALWLLRDFSYDNSTIMLTPLESFYTTPGYGVDEVRIAYILEENELKKAMTVLDKALESYPGRK